MNQADPTLALQSIGDQLVRTTLSALRTGVGYEVRTEVVGEKGSGMIGLDVGLMRTRPSVYQLEFRYLQPVSDHDAAHVIEHDGNA